MIAVEKLSKSYGKQILFEDISFKINLKDRVGVVGRNGNGKTTLLRMINGEEEFDSGQIIIPKFYRIGYLKQKIDFSQESVISETAKSLPLSEQSQLWRAEKVLSGLGFEKQDFFRNPYDFSAGFQVRINLAKVLLSEANLLLLDEPNNFLDIMSIRWLSQFLKGWAGEIMLITHDRNFMDKVVTHTLGIHRKKVRKLQGNTEKYYTQIAQDEETYEKTRLNDERKLREAELFITRFRAKARLGGLVQSRIKSIEKMEKREKLDKIRSLDFSFKTKSLHSKYVCNVSNISFSFEPQKPLINNFTISIQTKDRILVIGKNGKGKTTLLKLLAGFLEPQSGTISTPLAVSAGYYEQANVHDLSENNTVLEEIASVLPDNDPKQARYICGLMMFEGNNALKRIHILSGGEKSRVILGKIIAFPTNLLILDEPTNHLDLESSDALLAALDNFAGTVILVTHNEMFLHALSERLIIFQGDEVRVHEGNYQSFLEKIGWQEEAEKIYESKKEYNNLKTFDKRDLRKKRSELYTERSKILKPLEKKINEFELAIETEEAELNKMNNEIIEVTKTKESARIVELSKNIHSSKTKLDFLLNELEEVFTRYEKQKSIIEEKLKELGVV